MWKPVTVPKLLRKAYPKRRWSVPNTNDHLYITFDDGPIPQLTPWVLEQLRAFESKATFFCIGDNAHKHPELLHQIVAEGHAVGNHTQRHLNGWKTPLEPYLDDVTACETTLTAILKRKPLLFRPPYGKLTSKQARNLREQGYELIMWSVLSYDYDGTISKEQCLEKVLTHMKPGSIIVFHDSLKAENKLRFVLPKVLEAIQKRGWKARPLSDVWES